ncbi:MAG: hypothetical protein BA866_10560 [Desulfobulbaceae bacterium S5133MH15]|nr:MAG: hypothetical protein BA866_10560 [Desulfobulbaceae bacterium S5133MH15]
MHGTSIESHFVVHLEMARHSKTAPDRPQRLVDGASASAEQWLRSTSASAEIHDIQAVESDDAVIPTKMTRSHNE